MDEMTVVREILHDSTSCPPQSMVAARTRLDEAMRTGAGAPGPARSRVATPLRWSLAGSGLLAAVAVAAVVASANTVAPPAATPSRPAPQAQASAQQILLAAASRAELAPATSGRFWHVKSLRTDRYLVSAGYHVTATDVREEWTPTSSKDFSWSGGLPLGVKPSTPADEQAWRADGSPTEWQIPFPTLSSRPGKPTLMRDPGRVPYLGENQVSLAELQKLPTDPAKLHAWLNKRVMAQGGITSDEILQSQVFSTLVELLAETPATPALRAAALRVLAAMPSVRNAGTGTDARGRTGVRIVFHYGNAYGYAGEMIIDPAGPAVLEIKQTFEPGGQRLEETDTVILTAGWTNTKPQLPTAP